jgi:hypothetical protein
MPVEEQQQPRDRNTSFKRYVLIGESPEGVDLKRDHSLMREFIPTSTSDGSQHVRLHYCRRAADQPWEKV